MSKSLIFYSKCVFFDFSSFISVNNFFSPILSSFAFSSLLFNSMKVFWLFWVSVSSSVILNIYSTSKAFNFSISSLTFNNSFARRLFSFSILSESLCFPKTSLPYSFMILSFSMRFYLSLFISFSMNASYFNSSSTFY